MQSSTSKELLWVLLVTNQIIFCSHWCKKEHFEYERTHNVCSPKFASQLFPQFLLIMVFFSIHLHSAAVPWSERFWRSVGVYMCRWHWKHQDELHKMSELSEQKGWICPSSAESNKSRAGSDFLALSYQVIHLVCADVFCQVILDFLQTEENDSVLTSVGFQSHNTIIMGQLYKILKCEFKSSIREKGKEENVWLPFLLYGKQNYTVTY